MTETEEPLKSPTKFFDMRDVKYLVAIVASVMALWYSQKAEFTILQHQVSALQTQVKELRDEGYATKIAALEIRLSTAEQTISELKADMREKEKKTRRR